MNRNATTPSRPPDLDLPCRRDSRAWRLQVWASFGLALALSAIGLAWLPGDDLDRAFMVMGYVFCLSSAFALAKLVRDNQAQAVDSGGWRALVWGGFAVAMALTAWGLWRMGIQPVWKAYLLVCWLFLIAQAFTLAKTLRDGWEADLADARRAGRLDAARNLGAASPERADAAMSAAPTA